MRNYQQIVIVIIGFTLFPFCNKDNKQKSKIKQEWVTRYFYKLGVPETKSFSTDTTIYNEFEFPTEETNSSTSTKTIYKYERDTQLVSMTKYRGNGNILYKKNISYNDKGKKTMLKIYETFSTTKTPELVAGMKFFYDTSGKVLEKKYFGAINYNEEEQFSLITEGPNADDMIKRERKRQADSTSAKYVRTKEGKVGRIYFNNDTNNCINYSYNSDGKLVSKLDRFGLGKYYIYNKNKLIQTKDIEYSAITLKTFNEKGKVIEVQKLDTKDGSVEKSFPELIWKTRITYSDNGLLKEVIRFNNIGEPESVDKYEYEFF